MPRTIAALGGLQANESQIPVSLVRISIPGGERRYHDLDVPLFMDPGTGSVAMTRDTLGGATLNLHGVSATIFSASAIGKATGAAAWDSGVRSTESWTQSVYLAFTPAKLDRHGMLGLNSDPTADASYVSLDYAFYCKSNLLEIYESGVLVGSYGLLVASTRLAITYDGDCVRYLKDGVVVRTVARPVGAALFLDSSINTPGAGAMFIDICVNGLLDFLPGPGLEVPQIDISDEMAFSDVTFSFSNAEGEWYGILAANLYRGAAVTLWQGNIALAPGDSPFAATFQGVALMWAGELTFIEATHEVAKLVAEPPDPFTMPLPRRTYGPPGFLSIPVPGSTFAWGYTLKDS